MNKINSNVILIIGNLIVILLAILWYFQIVSEPLVGIGVAVLTGIGYILTRNESSPTEKTKNIKAKINQRHKGKGDNVAGDKIINN